MFEKIMAWIAAVPYGNALYWVPFAVCAIVYTVRVFRDVKNDIHARDNSTYYTPSVTVGVIFGYIVVTVLPAINLLAAVFDCMPGITKFLGRTFDIPLVRDSQEAAQKRQALRQQENAARS